MKRMKFDTYSLFDALDKRIKYLEEKIRELEEKLDEKSSICSLPHDTDEKIKDFHEIMKRDLTISWD